MVVQVHKSGDTYSFTLPPQAREALALVDGETIEIQRSIEIERSEEAAPKIRYVSMEQALKAYESTLGEYGDVYRELAK